MPLLTDEEAKALALLCPPHKIILDGGGLVATIQSACTLAYKEIELIQETPELKDLAFELAMALHFAEKKLEPMLKKLTMRIAQIDYGTSAP